MTEQKKQKKNRIRLKKEKRFLCFEEILYRVSQLLDSLTDASYCFKRN